MGVSNLREHSKLEKGVDVISVDINELTNTVPEFYLPVVPGLQINRFHYYSSRDTSCYIVFDIDSVYYNDIIEQISLYYELSEEHPLIFVNELIIKDYNIMYIKRYDDDYIYLFEYPPSESRVQFILCYDGYNDNLDRYIRSQIHVGNTK